MTWKSVIKDGLPPRDSDGQGESEVVLVAIYYGHRPEKHRWHITTGYYTGEEFGWRDSEFFLLNVSYWMEKPAPPTEIPEVIDGEN